MKIKLFHGFFPSGKRLLMNIMRVFILLFFGTAFSLNTIDGLSQNTKITFNAEASLTVDEIFDVIEEQTPYNFIYRSDMFSGFPKIHVKKGKIAIKKLLKDENLAIPFVFVVEDENIIVKEASAAVVYQIQQQQTISGAVTDENGVPLPAVNITVEGTSKGTTTDFDGNYEIEVEKGQRLKFSSIGFEDQAVEVGESTIVNITMKEGSALDEVVVVGYGTQKKGSVLGSVSQINAEKIEKRTLPDLQQTLSGQMPGVTVIQRSGRPGDAGNSSISIRGVGSFGAGSGALVLVDGLPGSLSDINPNDVESVSVLKDAAASAIYGSRAANGVILVTTKDGRSGKLNVSYQGHVGFQKATSLPELVDSWDYAELYNEATGNEVYTEEDINLYKSGEDLENYPNTKFVDEVFSRSKPIQTAHNFQIRGGDKNNQYFLSLGYLSQEGLVQRNNYERYNLRLNVTNKLAHNLTLTTRLSGTKREISEPAPPGGIEFNNMMLIINESVRVPSIYTDKYSNGDYGSGHANMGTPVSFLESGSSFRDKPFAIRSNMKLEWTPLDYLKISVAGGYNKSMNKSKRFLVTQRINAGLTLGPSSLQQVHDETTYRNTQALIEFDKIIKEHEIGVLAGYSFEDNYYETMTGFRKDFPTNDLKELNVGSSEGQEVNGTANEWALQSFFGRIKYAYDNKYLFESTMRYDGSSRFPTDNKYAFFPSVALAWRLSEEPFFYNSINVVNDFKLKMSYGELGNQNIGNYAYQNVFSTGYDYPFGGSLHSGVAITQLTDNNLRWEKTTDSNMGVEFVLFENSLSGEVNYFNRKTIDILYRPAGNVSSVLGKSISETNTGSLRNRGWEFEVTYNKKWNDFNITLSPNFSIIKNEVLSLGEGNVEQPNGLIGNGSDLFIGHPMQIYYGYEADGLYVDENDISTGPDVSKINPNPKPGDIKYKDLGGEAGKPDGKVDPEYDRKVLGSRIPKYTYGLNIGASYKKIDFSALVQGVSGVKGKLDNYAGLGFYNTASIQKWMMDNRWTPANPDPNASYPRLETIPNTGTPNTLSSSYWILNASYIRLKSIQLGYTFPDEFNEKFRTQNVRVYVSGENLYTWNHYPKGWDPEINSGGQFYPILANYSLGVNITF